MVIEESILIKAEIKKTWDVFMAVACWKEWSTVMEDVLFDREKISPGGSIDFCIRPFLFPVRIKPKIEEVVLFEKISWTGRKFGVIARHEFVFYERPKGTLVKSRETFTGVRYALWSLLIGRPRLKSLTIRMLEELKKACEHQQS